MEEKTVENVEEEINVEEKTVENSEEETNVEEKTVNEEESTGSSNVNEGNGSDAILSELSDKDIIMNFASIEDLCSQWNSKTVALDLTGSRVEKGLKVCTSYGIYETYAASLATAVNSLTTTITEVTSQVKNASDVQKGVDLNYSSGRISGNYNYGSYSGSNSDSSSNTSVNNNKEDDDITVANIEKIATLNDYIGLSTLLYSVSTDKNTSLEDVLSDFDSTVIKEKILSSVNLSDDLKKILYDLDSSVLKDTLTQLQKSGSIQEFSTTNVEYLNSYLKKVALRNNMTVTDLITNNKDLLYEELGIYEKAINLLDNKEVAQNIYDGNEISDMDSDIVLAARDVIDIMADKNKITAEELLESQNNLNSISNSKSFISFIKSGSNLENVLKEICT